MASPTMAVLVLTLQKIINLSCGHAALEQDQSSP